MKINKIGFLFIVTMIISCNNKIMYDSKTEIEVKYIDNTKDTIIDYTKWEGNPSYNIKTSVTGFIDQAAIAPTLTNESNYKQVASYVKSFKIISQTKFVSPDQGQ